MGGARRRSFAVVLARDDVAHARLTVCTPLYHGTVKVRGELEGDSGRLGTRPGKTMKALQRLRLITDNVTKKSTRKGGSDAFRIGRHLPVVYDKAK